MLVGRDIFAILGWELWHIQQYVHRWSPQICAATYPGKKNTATGTGQKQAFIGNRLNCS